MRVEYARCGKAEQVRYSVDGKLWGTVFSDAEAFAEIIPSASNVVFRPNEFGGGYSMLGFVLPPGASGFFVREFTSSKGLAGDGCPASEAGCREYELPFHFQGNNQIVRLDRARSRIDNSMMGHPQATWSFEGVKKGYPAHVAFKEWRGDAQVAEAEYEFVSTSKSPGELRRVDVVPKGATMQISKDGTTFSTLYDPNVRDIWGHYRQQERIWVKVDAANRPNYGLFALGFLTILAVVWYVVTRTKPGAK